MVSQSESPRLTEPEKQRALALLASSADGCTESILLLHDFTIDQMAELVQAGLATAEAERIVVGERTIEVARLRITDAGRKAIGHPTA